MRKRNKGQEKRKNRPNLDLENEKIKRNCGKEQRRHKKRRKD